MVTDDKMSQEPTQMLANTPGDGADRWQALWNSHQTISSHSSFSSSKYSIRCSTKLWPADVPIFNCINNAQNQWTIFIPVASEGFSSSVLQFCWPPSAACARMSFSLSFACANHHVAVWWWKLCCKWGTQSRHRWTCSPVALNSWHPYDGKW